MGTLSFTSVKGLRPKKNRFNKSYLKAFPSTMGKLIPVHTDFVIPGSWVEMKSSLFTRTQALVAPVMDNISTYVHYWKIPVRLVDKKFTKFIGGEIAPEEYNPLYFVPKDFYTSLGYFNREGILNNIFDVLPFAASFLDKWLFEELVYEESLFNSSLLDLLGYNGDFHFWTSYEGVVNLFEFKAYLLLLKVWYINENITIHCPCYVNIRGNNYSQDGDTFVEAIEDFLTLEGNQSQAFAAFYLDLVGNFGEKALFNHAWAKDYFTSALPNTQYGEEVTIPLGSTAPVTGDLVARGQSLIANSEGLTVGVTGSVQSSKDVTVDPSVGPGVGKLNADGTPINTISGNQAILRNVEGLNVDLSEATAISILELRIAETLQVYKERIMRAGRKYREYLKMFFDVTSSDARLQDPEWLGGGKVSTELSTFSR